MAPPHEPAGSVPGAGAGGAVHEAAATAPPFTTKAGIHVPANDKYSYKHLVLLNGLQCLLIHDPEGDKAAAAMDVRVGSFSDPADLPGLAHLLEHMLFYSSEKYPAEDEYSKFLAEHGGSSNAWTAAESTNYHFVVNQEHFAEALDRFAQFFLCPLISADGVARELNAVHAEHSKNLLTDAWRQLQLWRHVADPAHAFHKFGTGSMTTLQVPGIDLHARLLQFYRTHYSAGLMRLCVCGRESLEALEALVRPRFEAVRDTGKTPDRFPTSPFETGAGEGGAPEPSSTPAAVAAAAASPYLGVLIRTVPTKTNRVLAFQWLVPAEVKAYTCSPCGFLGHLLGHEAEGTACAVLKHLGWATGLSAGEAGSGWSEHSMFSVQVELTEAGSRVPMHVGAVIFTYLRLVAARGVHGLAWAWAEKAALARTRFDWRDKLGPLAHCRALAGAMQEYPVAHLLLACAGVPVCFDPSAIQAVLSELLRPGRARVMHTAREHAGEGAPLAEAWYDTAYGVQPLPAEWVEAWTTDWTPPSPDADALRLRLPSKNPFVPTRFEVLGPQGWPAGGLFPPAPRVVLDTPLLRGWWKPDTLGFGLPKAVAQLNFTSPAAYTDPVAVVCTRLFCRLLADYLNSETYYAEIAGLGFSITNTATGFLVSAIGWSDTLPRLLAVILGAIEAFQVRPARFADVRERAAQDYANVRFEQAYSAGIYASALLLEHQRFSWEEYEVAAPRITADQLTAFVPRLFASCHVEALLSGNFTRPGAVELLKGLEAKLIGPSAHMRAGPIAPSLVPERRGVALAAGVRHVYVRDGPNLDEENSCLVQYLQLGPEEECPAAVCQLWTRIASRAAFLQLRTQEQLGYIVFVRFREDCGVHGLDFIIQSVVASPQQLEARVENFVSNFGARLAAMEVWGSSLS